MIHSFVHSFANTSCFINDNQQCESTNQVKNNSLSSELDCFFISALRHGSSHIFGLHTTKNMNRDDEGFVRRETPSKVFFSLRWWWWHCDLPLARTPWAADGLPGSRTGSQRRQESPEWLPAGPSQPPRPSCCPAGCTSHHNSHTPVTLVGLWAFFQFCCVIEFVTRILSKAEGVPPLWTWPRTVARVSKPSLSVTSWRI